MAVYEALVLGTTSVWLALPPSDHDEKTYDVPPLVCVGALTVCRKPTTWSITNGARRRMPSISSSSPLGTVSKAMSTFSGTIVTNVEAESPEESVTVRTRS